MDGREYRRMTLGQLQGRKVELMREVQTRQMRIPVGTVMTIRGKFKGLELETEPCDHCGVVMRVARLHPSSVRLLQEEGGNADR